MAVSVIRYHPFFSDLLEEGLDEEAAVIADSSLPCRMGAGVSLREVVGSLQKPLSSPVSCALSPTMPELNGTEAQEITPLNWYSYAKVTTVVLSNHDKDNKTR